ncbi:MAG: hypothetical protein ACRC3Y_05720 [Romboutsia sp.]|uniref:hypothetical protein n=1 Tax=Romboutsia sp. TaxID=1965302 RepID=UPI003F3E0E25
MSIECLKPLEIEFTGSIGLDCAMNISYDFNQNEADFKDFGISVNAEKLYLSLKAEEEIIDPPIIIDKECAAGGKLTIDKVVLNKLYLSGSIDFVIDANLVKNSNNVVIENNIDLAWPSTHEQICVDNYLLAYAYSIDDIYTTKVTVKNLHLHRVEQMDSNLDIFYFLGTFVIEPVLL